jgi:hypothetical protein
MRSSIAYVSASDDAHPGLRVGHRRRCADSLTDCGDVRTVKRLMEARRCPSRVAPPVRRRQVLVLIRPSDRCRPNRVPERSRRCQARECGGGARAADIGADEDRRPGGLATVALCVGVGRERRRRMCVNGPSSAQGRGRTGSLRGSLMARVVSPHRAGDRRSRVFDPGAAAPKSPAAGLTLPQAILLFQALFKCWTGRCHTCQHPIVSTGSPFTQSHKPSDDLTKHY